tara:strand:+ start:10295 stop:11068 length:774 start_codon:yes stop_codon:yes gene_type:complete
MILGGAKPEPPAAPRFYNHNGELAHTIIGSNGKPRAPRVTDIKRHKLVPRTSTVLEDFSADSEFFVAKRAIEEFVDVLFDPETGNDPRSIDEADMESMIMQSVMLSMKAQSDHAEFGTKFHDAADRDVWGGPVARWEAPYRRFMEEHVAETIYSEKTLTCAFWGGTVDRVVRTASGKTAIIDWKTQSFGKSPTFYSKWALQMASYEPMLDVPIDEWWSVVVPSREPVSFILRVWPDPEKWKRLWWNAYNFWKEKHLG